MARTSARDINDHGQVVGWSNLPDSTVRAFVWTSADGMVALPPLPGYARSEALFVNNSGQVAGVSCSTQNVCRATMWVGPRRAACR